MDNLKPKEQKRLEKKNNGLKIVKRTVNRFLCFRQKDQGKTTTVKKCVLSF